MENCYNLSGDALTVGENTQLFHGTYLNGKIVIGSNSLIGPLVVIGSPPQHRKYYANELEDLSLFIEIGSNTVIREFSTVHQPTDNRNTIIGDNCFLMAYSHISHDTQLGDNIVLANNVQIGGHTTIMSNANIGLNVCIHQFSTIGSFSMIGMGSIISKDVPPFVIFYNRKCRKINKIGLERTGFTEEDISLIADYYSNNQTIDSLPAHISKIINDFHAFRNPQRSIANIELK